jgi:hypothetical protein
MARIGNYFGIHAYYAQYMFTNSSALKYEVSGWENAKVLRPKLQPAVFHTALDSKKALWL